MDKSNLNKKIGNRIIALRKEKGWKQSDLARACLKDRQSIEKLENGKVNPTAYTLYEISQALQINIKTFFEF